MALTASCSALASDSAFCLVSASWSSFCDWPEPPQPLLQSDELSWVWPAFCSVQALLEASESASLSSFCSAELSPPPRTSPPPIEIGTLALTAFCLALASDSAFCLVSASWSSFCDWPEPPQPYLQSDELSWVWPAFCSVQALLEASESASLSSFCSAELSPPFLPCSSFLGCSFLGCSSFFP